MLGKVRRWTWLDSRGENHKDMQVRDELRGDDDEVGGEDEE